MVSCIRDELNNANNDPFFCSKNIRVDLLKDCPQQMTTIAQWQYDDWHKYDTALTIERLLADFQKQLQEESMPFTIVASRQTVPIATISLKKQPETELADLPGPWPGTFHVIATERDQGIGRKLGELVIRIAKRLGYPGINFYTSDPQNVPKYVRAGAAVLETRPFRGHTITVLKMTL